MKKIFLIVFGIIYCQFIITDLYAQEVLQWRESDRSAVYPEKNLKCWPEAGPGIIWEATGLGNGFGFPVITSKNIFINQPCSKIEYETLKQDKPLDDFILVLSDK